MTLHSVLRVIYFNSLKIMCSKPNFGRHYYYYQCYYIFLQSTSFINLQRNVHYNQPSKLGNLNRHRSFFLIYTLSSRSVLRLLLHTMMKAKYISYPISPIVSSVFPIYLIPTGLMSMYCPVVILSNGLSISIGTPSYAV